MRAKPERRAASPSTAVPATPLPEGWYDVFRWLQLMAPAADTAEKLTVEVCCRMRVGKPVWLADKAADVQQRFFVAQVILEHRGVLSAGVWRSVGPRPVGGAEPGCGRGPIGTVPDGG